MPVQPPSSAASPLSLAHLNDPPAFELVDEEVVAAFDSLLHAELVRGRLEASGIGARLQDAHTVGLASHLAQAVGGVKVVVAKGDADEARTLLQTPVVFDDDELPLLKERHVDDVAGWALKLSLLGILLPVIGQIGSLAFALGAWPERHRLSGRGRRQLSIAIAIDVSVVVALGASLL